MKSRLVLVRKAIVLGGVIALLSGATSQAQDYMPSFSNGNLSADIANTIMNNTLMEAQMGINRERSERVAPSDPVMSARTSRAGAYATTYQASAAVTERVKRQFADFVRSTGGDGAGIAAAMNDQDFFARWGGHVSQYGLRRGDVADAMTAYWVLNWQIANDVRSVDRSQVQAVKAQVRQNMTSNTQFGALNNAQKQEMAEALILNFIAQSVAYEDAMRANDATMQRRLQNAARTRLRNEMNVDLRQLRLGGSGFTAAS